MAILIDGYNLLHAAGMIPRGIGAGTLERARSALLNWLVATLDPTQRAETTVVFDAANPPPGLPRQFDHHGVTVMYSTEHEDADALLEQLIRQAAVPKRLVVVSSDHRVQRAARRRRATPMDSDVWYTDVQRQRNRAPLTPPVDTKPSAPLSSTEVQDWLDEFSDLIDDLHDLETEQPAKQTDLPAASDDQTRGERPTGRAEAPHPPADANPPAGANPPADGRTLVDDEPRGAKPADADLANPFPPGYGEDLLRPDADLDEP